jgi:dTDP-4-dehydrorhamnose 3,5-epimerase
MGRIEGVMVKELAVIPDARGRLMEILRSDEEIFAGFGQVYLTTTYPGVVKAWHLHRKQTDPICCVAGMLRLGLYDGREGSPTRGLTNEFYLGVHRPLVVVVPPGVHHGWKCVGQEEALIINTVTRPYDHADPDEERLDPHDNHIPWDWATADG